MEKSDLEIKEIWGNATQHDEDLELIRQFFEKNSLGMDASNVSTFGLKVNRDDKYTSILLPIRNADCDLVGLKKYEVSDDASPQTSLSLGRYTAGFYQFGFGRIAIVMVGLENAIAYWRNIAYPEKYTYLVTLSFLAMTDIASIYSEFDSVRVILDNNSDNHNSDSCTEELANYGVKRFRHPRKNYDCWKAEKEDKFVQWFTKLEEVPYIKSVEPAPALDKSTEYESTENESQGVGNLFERTKNSDGDVSEVIDVNNPDQKDDIPQIASQEITYVGNIDGKEATDDIGSSPSDKTCDGGNPNPEAAHDPSNDLTDEKKIDTGSGKGVPGDDETAELQAISPVDVEIIGSPVAVNMDELLREHNEIITCRDLTKLEKTIKEQSPRLYIGIVKVGAALSTIKEYKLFSQHGNFTEYCASVLGISKTYSYDIVRAYEVFKNFSAIAEKTNNLELITHESHLREIAKLKDKDDQLTVFNRAVAEIQGQPLTAAKLSEVVSRFNVSTKEFSEKPIEKPPKNKRSKRIMEAKNIKVNNEMISIPLSDPEVKSFFDEFIKLVSDGNSVEIQYKEAKQK